MILSRMVARRRIAAGDQPSWAGAWGLVALDAVILFAVLFVVFDRVMSLLSLVQPGGAVTFLVMVVVIFIPMQVVLILSALWAAKSRWVDDTRDDA